MTALKPPATTFTRIATWILITTRSTVVRRLPDPNAITIVTPFYAAMTKERIAHVDGMTMIVITPGAIMTTITITVSILTNPA